MGKGSVTEEYLEYYTEYSKLYGPETVVFMQMGAFYEMMSVSEKVRFDIHKVCGILNINVTRRDKGTAGKEATFDNPYLAGFPLASLNKYTLSLIDHNYTVVVVEQHAGTGGAPPNGKRLARKVAGVYSRGAMPLDLLDTRECVLMTVLTDPDVKDYISAVCIDVSANTVTVYEGDMSVSELVSSNGVTELVVYTGNDKLDNELSQRITVHTFRSVPDNTSNVIYKDKFLRRVYKHIEFGMVSPTEYFDLHKRPMSSSCLVCALMFLESHNERYLVHLNPPRFVESSQHLALELNTLEQLNIFSKTRRRNDSVFNVIDHTVTSIGRKELRLRLSRPYKFKSDIEHRLRLCDAIEALDQGEFGDLTRVLSETADVSKLYRKMALNIADTTTIVAIRDTFVKLADLLDRYTLPVTTVPLKESLVSFVKCVDETIDTTNTSNTVPFLTGLFPELDDLTTKLDSQYGVLEALRSEFETPEVKLGSTDTEYYFTTTKIRMEVMRKRVRPDVLARYRIRCNSSAVTLKSDATEEASNEIQSIKANLKRGIQRRTHEFVERLCSEYGQVIDDSVMVIGSLDIAASSVAASRRYNYCRPVILDGDASMVTLTGLRHPVIERVKDTLYVPTDLSFDDAHHGMILYAINSTGKSSLLRSLGIAVLLAQCGMYVPASGMTLVPFHTIASQVDMQDNIVQSSFVAEMTGLRKIAKVANEHCLILSDELTKGTEHISATSIFASTVLFLRERGAKFLFTTHLTEVSKLDEITKCTGVSICHLSVKITGGVCIFERILKPGPCDELYGLEIAQATGVDRNIIERAKTIRNTLTGRGRTRTVRSRYNAKKIIDSCEVCGYRPEHSDHRDLETHHVHFQNTADDKGFISHFHKNATGNLVALCRSCHTNLHKGTFHIDGYIETTDGIKLKTSHKNI